MAKIHVHTPFTLSKDDGTKVPFAAGSHDVDGDVAGHWYVKLHTGEKPARNAAPPGAPDADSASAAINARLAEIERAEKGLADERERLDEIAATLDQREDALIVRETAVTERDAAVAQAEAEREAAAQRQLDTGAKDGGGQAKVPQQTQASSKTAK